MFVANGRISFFLLWLNNIASYACMHFCIHSSIERYVGYFHVLAIVNTAAVNMAVLISLQDMISFPSDISSAGLLQFWRSSLSGAPGASSLWKMLLCPMLCSPGPPADASCPHSGQSPCTLPASDLKLQNRSPLSCPL